MKEVMSYDHYVITTMMKAGSKILPVVVSLIVGYLLFIKLPFYFFRQTLKDSRKFEDDRNLPKFPEEPKFMRLEDKIRRDAEDVKKEQQKFQQQQQKKKDEPKKDEKKDEKKKEEPKREAPKRPAATVEPSPESVFELKPGERLTPEELKSRYHDLLKQSHPDRVASMGPDFKKLAEKKTKELNDAYAKLKKKAS